MKRGVLSAERCRTLVYVDGVGAQKKRMEREGSKPGEEGSATTGSRGKPPHTRQYTIHAIHTILDRAIY